MNGTRNVLRINAPEMQAKLGCSTIAVASRFTDRLGAKEISMIREAGIRNIELGGYNPPGHYDYSNHAQIAEISSECRKQGVKIVSVHGPGMGFIYDTPYEELRRAAVREIIAAARVAGELGAGIFVTHLGMSGFDDNSEKTATELLEALKDSPIKLTVENGADLRVFAAFVDRIGSSRFGMTVDLGHTRDGDGVNPFIKDGRAYEALSACKSSIFHVHLHDFADTDHCPPFDGNIRWKEVLKGLRDTGYTGALMFECAARTSPSDTLKKIAGFPGEFLRRYPGTEEKP